MTSCRIFHGVFILGLTLYNRNLTLAIKESKYNHPLVPLMISFSLKKQKNVFDYTYSEDEIKRIFQHRRFVNLLILISIDINLHFAFELFWNRKEYFVSISMVTILQWGILSFIANLTTTCVLGRGETWIWHSFACITELTIIYSTQNICFCCL